MKLVLAVLLQLVPSVVACPFAVKVSGGNRYSDKHTGVYTRVEWKFRNFTLDQCGMCAFTPVYEAVHARGNGGGMGRFIYFVGTTYGGFGGRWFVVEGVLIGDVLRFSHRILKSTFTDALCPSASMGWNLWVDDNGKNGHYISEPFLAVTEAHLSITSNRFFRPVFMGRGASDCPTNQPSEQAVDGSWETYWGCYGTFPRSYYADLGGVYVNLRGVEIAWGPYAADSFTVAVSMDNKSFTEVIVVKDQNGVAQSNCDQILLTPYVAAQFIRVDIIKVNAESTFYGFSAVTIRELSFSIADLADHGRWQTLPTQAPTLAATNRFQFMSDSHKGLEGTTSTTLTSTTTRLYFWLIDGQMTGEEQPPEPAVATRRRWDISTTSAPAVVHWSHWTTSVDWTTTSTTSATTMVFSTTSVPWNSMWSRELPRSDKFEHACSSGHKCVDESTLLGLGCPGGYFCLGQGGCCEACPSGHSWKNGPIIQNCDVGYRQSDKHNFGYYGCCEEDIDDGLQEEFTTTYIPALGQGGNWHEDAVELKHFKKAAQGSFIKHFIKRLESLADTEPSGTSTASPSQPSHVEAIAATAAPGAPLLQIEKLPCWVNPWFIAFCALLLTALCAGILLGIVCHARLTKLDRTPLLEGAPWELNSIHAAQPAAEFHQMA